jgi:uncharacterized protein
MSSNRESGRHQGFVDTALQNPINRKILARLSALALSDCWLVAGCLFQTVWNIQSRRPVADGIKDYDIFYYDPHDLSWDAEDRVIRRIRAAFADLGTDLGIAIDVKNQARVHLWYAQHFGAPCPPLTSAQDGIDRFLVAGTCVGLALRPDTTLELYAPFGLDDCRAGFLRPNPLNADPLVKFHAKAASYRNRWPHLSIDPRPAPQPTRKHVTRVRLDPVAQGCTSLAVHGPPIIPTVKNIDRWYHL